MFKIKLLALGLVFSFTTAFAAQLQNESVTNIDHPPKPEKISESLHLSSIKENSFKSIDSLISIEKFPTTQVDSIKDVTNIKLHTKNLYTLEIFNEDNQYQILNIQELLLKNEWYFEQDSLEQYNIKIKKLKKMQRLATYIANQYNVSLMNAEKIVYSTFTEAGKKNLEPTLVLSLIDIESTFKQFSKSRSGAVGLTQVMAKIHKGKIKELYKENMDIWSINGNIKVGTQILKEYVDLAGGNLKKALQMYNGTAKDSHYRYSNKIMSKMDHFNKIASL